MRIILLCGLIFGLASSTCNRTQPDGQVVWNPAFITATSVDTLTGQQCEMTRCPTTSVKIRLNMSADEVLITSQMCNMTNNNQMGCAANQYVETINILDSWYTPACPFCESVCDAANAMPRTDVARNTKHLRFFELNHEGKVCHMMACADGGCISSSWHPTNKSGYAYYPALGMTSMWYFPDLSDKFKKRRLNDPFTWSEFEVPNTYACPNEIAQSDPLVCDHNDGGTNYTFWTGTMHFQLEGTVCKVKQCAGSNSMTDVYDTATINAGTVAVPFKNYILEHTDCRNNLRGCLDNPSQWYWGPKAWGDTISTTHCQGVDANFCSRLACKCTSSTGTKEYRAVAQKASGTGHGRMRDDYYYCYSSTCLAANVTVGNPAILADTYVKEDESYWIPITAAAANCPLNKFYYTTSSSPVLRGGVETGGAAVAFRRSTLPNAVSNTAWPELYCSALGYANANPSLTDTPMCYRSRGYFLYSASSTFNCKDQNVTLSGSQAWNVDTCPGSACIADCSPIKNCVTVTKSSTNSANSYQYAGVEVYNRRWAEVQCFPNGTNFKMESICSKMSDRVEHLVDYQPMCNRDSTMFDVFRKVVSCRTTSGGPPVPLSPTADPIFKTDVLMQNNQCDAAIFTQAIQLHANCACQEVMMKSKGATAFKEQGQRAFYEAYTTGYKSSEAATLRGYLQLLGCTYRVTCDTTSGSATVTVKRPKFSATYVINTMCRYVDWTGFKANLQAVLGRNGGVPATHGGRWGGVQVDWMNAKDMPTATPTMCEVKFWTFFTSPEWATWFNGNLSLPTKAFAGIKAGSAVLVDDEASPARTTSFANHNVPSLVLLVVLLVASTL